MSFTYDDQTLFVIVIAIFFVAFFIIIGFGEMKLNQIDKKRTSREAKEKRKLLKDTREDRYNRIYTDYRMAKAELPDCFCLKCRYDWTSRKKRSIPIRCPRCKSESWWTKEHGEDIPVLIPIFEKELELRF